MALYSLFNQKRVEDRTITEFIGIAKGMVADGVISEGEANFLQLWLQENYALADVWPVRPINERVRQMFADGIIDAKERLELFEILKQLAGGESLHENITSFSSTLPISQPQPHIIIKKHSFCFTGKFAYGLRSDCERAVSERGGIICSNIVKNLDYLIVGFIGTKDWAHSSFGRKIEKAVSYRENGYGLEIVSEETWVKYV
jgi:NAD-dependent DNA ligase